MRPRKGNPVAAAGTVANLKNNQVLAKGVPREKAPSLLTFPRFAKSNSEENFKKESANPRAPDFEFGWKSNSRRSCAGRGAGRCAFLETVISFRQVRHVRLAQR
jgi:hypothetical protein